MSAPRRRALPDNLDPLVDTLTNVVGILVIVVALTQLELGDALARVAMSEATPAASEATLPSEIHGGEIHEAEQVALAERLDQLRARGVDDLATAAEALRRSLADLSFAADAGAASSASSSSDAGGARTSLEMRVARARETLATARANDAHRRAYASALVTVPRQLVARLPDPERVEGREAWILVRYGRVYLVDREALFDEGRRAIERIVPDGATRPLRPDEFGSVSHYLRKSEIGLGVHRWQLTTEPSVRLGLVWRTRDGGIESSRLATDPELAKWLADRRPDLDTIRFHVWSDSFETYLEARARVEAAGFRAGWRGHEADEELEIGLRFGSPEPEVRPVEVD